MHRNMNFVLLFHSNSSNIYRVIKILLKRYCGASRGKVVQMICTPRLGGHDKPPPTSQLRQRATMLVFQASDAELDLIIDYAQRVLNVQAVSIARPTVRRSLPQ